MPYTFEKLPDAPAVMVVQSGSHVVQEINEMAPNLIPLLDAQPEPVFLVIDVRDISIGLEDLSMAAKVAAGSPDAALHHPHVRETLVISQNGTVRLAAEGLRSAIFGRVKVRVFDTPDQALAYCREQIALAEGQ